MSGRSGPSQPPQSAYLLSLTSEIDRLGRAVSGREYKPSVLEGKRLLKLVAVVSRPDLELRVRRYLGGAQLGSGLYRESLQTLLPARILAIKRGDFIGLYRINHNLGWIYLEMNNLEEAAEFADQSLRAARSSGKYDPAPVVLRAFIYAKAGDLPRAENLSIEAISHAMDSGDLVSAATAWHFLGASYLEAAQLDKAEFAETEAFHLRKLHHLPDLDQSSRDLARVLAQRGALHTASVLMDEALASMGDSKSTAPVWYFLRARGELRAMQGDLRGALSDLRAGLEFARRLDVIPTDDDRVTFQAGLAELYSLFIDTGNRLYLESEDPLLKEETFEAAELNRAASLEAIVPQINGWRTRLPPDHETILARLQSAERAALLDPDEESEARVSQLRASLNAVESQAGADREIGRISALTAARNALDGDSAVLAFHLAPRASWLWTITATKFEVHPLSPKSELAADAKRFRDAIRQNQPSRELGDALGRKLLGVLPADVHQKHRWIVALDQDLFDLPLAALRWNGRYLVEDHALLLTPGVRLMRRAAAEPPFHGELAGIGDAIYNRADLRWRAPGEWAAVRTFFGGWGSSDRWHLARLAGSGNEVRVSVQSWGSGSVFTGAKATKENVVRVVRESPAILHLATHVIRDFGKERSGLIVLGIDARGEPDFLDMREILLRPANLRLVVMSGCASGDAIALPASGLMGLTRAWLGAGASAVLATHWSALDDNGPFFASFYGNLRANPNIGAAEALRQAQVAMIRSHSFRSGPDYWGSYFLIGKF